MNVFKTAMISYSSDYGNLNIHTVMVNDNRSPCIETETSKFVV